MKFKTTIILAIIAIIGAAYVFLYEKKHESVEDRHKHQQKIFLGLSADSVLKIRLIKNGERFLFEKKNTNSYGRGGQWMMEEPIKTRADKAVINGFLSELEFLERVSSFQKEDAEGINDDKEDYGLDKPTFEITFWTGQTHIKGSENPNDSLKPDDITEYALLIGDRVSTGEHVYAKLTGFRQIGTSQTGSHQMGLDEVLVISDSIARKLDFGPNGFRDKWVMDMDEDAVSGIEILKASEDAVICSKVDDLWWMSKPVYDRCDNKKIAEIISSLRNLKIEETDFITDADGNLIKYGLDKLSFHLTLEQNGDKQGVLFGHLLDNKVYAKRDGESSVFLVKDIIVNELAIDPNTLRSRELVRFETVAGTLGVDRIEIKTPQAKISIKKTNEYDWRITEPIETLADMDAVKGLIEEAKDLRILEFVTDKSDDLTKYRLKDPLFDLAIYKEKMDKPIRIFFGSMADAGSQCYVKRPDEDPIFSITSKGIYEKLLGGLLTFRDKLVLEFDKELVNEVVVEKGGITFAIEKNMKKGVGQDGDWILKEPVSSLPDNSLIDQMVQAASFLKAKRYVAEAPVNRSGFGLDNPTIKATISYKKIKNSDYADAGGDVTEISEKDAAVNKTEKETGNQLTEQGDLDRPLDRLTSITLLIGNKISEDEGSNYFAIVEGHDLIFELDREIVNYFNSEIVSRSIQRFNAARAKRLVLSYRDNELVFERPEGVWKAVKPELGDIDSRQVEFMIWLLSDLRADQIMEYSLNNIIKYGLDNPDIKASVYLDDDSIFEMLAVSGNNGNDYFAMSRNSACIYTVNKEVIQKIIEQDVVSVKKETKTEN